MPDSVKTADKVLGIIGGLGPEATVDFFGRIVRITPAQSDQDHLHILIDNNPKVPNRNQALAGSGASPAMSLAANARRLEAVGAEFIVMACNTAHAFEDSIRNAISIPFISIVTETCTYIAENHPDLQSVGLLATDGCLQAQLYETALESHGIEVLTLTADRQKAFMDLVYEIKGQGVDQNIRSAMMAMTDELIELGAQGILAGCTEVPLVMTADDLSVPFIDSTEILAEQCVAYAKGLKPLVA